MKIGLDFDDVIVDVSIFKKDFYEKKLGIELEFASKKTLILPGHITLEEFNKLQDELYLDRERSLRELKLLDNSLEIIKKLQKKHSLTIITARSGPTLEIAKEILKNNNLDIPIIGVGYGKSKLDFLRDKDVFIDDDPDKLIDLIGEIPNLFIMTTKANIDFININIKRVNDWLEFEKEIEQIAS